jgi:hypothetical protein
MEEIKVEAPPVEDKPTLVPINRKGKPGRPKKSELQAVKDRTKGKLGRPKGDAGRLQEFKERLLATGGTKIIDKVVQVALNDSHPGQMAALKLCLDRVLPVSTFEAVKNAGNTPVVTINISGINDSATIETVEDVSDINFRDTE